MPYRPIQFVKTGLVIGSLLLVAGPLHAGRSPRIQGESFAFEIEPMPLPKAAKELAKLFGAPVKVSETLAPSTLAIWSPRTTVAEIRAKVAGAFNATWSLRGGVWYLEQTAQQVRAEDAAELEAKRLVIRRMLEKYREQVTASKPFDERFAIGLKDRLQPIVDAMAEQGNLDAHERLSAVGQEGPEARLIRRLLSRLSENHFLKVGIGERKVFALKPTPMQLPLGFDPKDDLNAFVAEQEVWSRVTNGKPIQPSKSNTFIYGGLTSKVQPVTQPVDNVYISISYAKEGLFTLNCMVTDPKGLFLAEGTGRSFTFDDEQRSFNVTLLGLGEKAKEDEPRLSPEGSLFRKMLYGQDLVTKQPANIPADFLNKAAKFTAKDPLAYSAWEFLKAEAKEQNVSIVANLPDPTVRLSYGILKFFENADRFKRASLYFGISGRDEPGWTILHPRSVKVERSLYRDRTMLEKQIELRRQGGASIEAQAAYAATLPENEDFSVFDELVNAFAPHKLPVYNDRFFLRLYGSMPKPLLEAMASPKGVLFTDLPRKVQEQIRRKVYYGGSYIFRFVSKTGENFTPTWQLFENGILKETTVSMPNGIPNGTTIRTTTSSKEMLRTTPTRQDWGMDQGELITPEDLAYNLFTRAHADVYPWALSRKEIPTKGIRVFRQRQITIEIDFKNELHMTRPLIDGELVATGSYTLETLPPSLKKRFFDRFNSLEEGFRKNPPKPAPKKDIPPL